VPSSATAPATPPAVEPERRAPGPGRPRPTYRRTL
jgi:hypothetical protein